MSLQPVGSTPSPAANARHDAYLMRQGDPAGSLTSNKEAAKSMKALLKKSKVQLHTCTRGGRLFVWNVCVF